MISVLIPNYNYDCLQLVCDLHAQLTRSGVPFEIIVAEDGSVLHVENNARAASLPGVRHIVRKENVGWFKIRNILPGMAKYPYLLCMDSDTRVVRSDYIQKYLDFARRGEKAVIVGGKTEMETGLPDPCYSLRFTYERKRENRPDKKKGFSTFNYMIPADVLGRVRFEDALFLTYGHEDTVFGLEFKRLGIPIKYIDNPLVHLGLDTNARMLEKAVSAGENLLRLYGSGKYPDLPSESRLLACYLKVRRWKMTGAVLFFYRILAVPVRKNLSSRTPGMLLFDFYRLGEMIRSAKKMDRVRGMPV